jgi:multidrug efflux pump subunit AcrA (membrane-fusion protein)
VSPLLTSNRQRWLAAGIGVVLLVAVIALVAGPARGLRGDIAIQKELLRKQLATTRTQLALQRSQLSIARRQLQIAQGQLAISRQTLTTARTTDQRVAIQLQISRQLLALAKLLNQIADDTRQHAANIDRKTGPPPPTGGAG